MIIQPTKNNLQVKFIIKVVVFSTVNEIRSTNNKEFLHFSPKGRLSRQTCS